LLLNLVFTYFILVWFSAKPGHVKCELSVLTCFLTDLHDNSGSQGHLGTKVELCTPYLNALRNIDLEDISQAKATVTSVLLATATDISASNVAGMSSDPRIML
jgi:hypothetical protein